MALEAPVLRIFKFLKLSFAELRLDREANACTGEQTVRRLVLRVVYVILPNVYVIDKNIKNTGSLSCCQSD
jgi:hypothetical protein